MTSSSIDITSETAETIMPILIPSTFATIMRVSLVNPLCRHSKSF